ncbi:hypothetical protein ACTIVE_7235 [Actinomadura verrucosospora]|uniref:Uncharacterized protein n=2 Tax=Actinomadura verrucosospora TaxID=46165 RepID=A0A7D3ZRB0_ACTVE|nr:hypothetical protein ACTIVE_7235 [Actinomadura verrucosospora]
MQPLTNTVKALLITVAVLAGSTVGLLAGMLHHMDGGSVPDAIVFGCKTFFGTEAFMLGLFGFWYGIQKRDT